jgi:hypothetical protein
VFSCRSTNPVNPSSAQESRAPPPLLPLAGGTFSVMVADAVAQYTVNDALHAANFSMNPINQESARRLL